MGLRIICIAKKFPRATEAVVQGHTLRTLTICASQQGPLETSGDISGSHSGWVKGRWRCSSAPSVDSCPSNRELSRAGGHRAEAQEPALDQSTFLTWG